MDMPLPQTSVPDPRASTLASFGFDFAPAPGTTSITSKLISVYDAQKYMENTNR